MSEEAELTKLAQEVTGKDNLKEALEVALRRYLEEMVEDYKQDMQALEARYGVSFEIFKAKSADKLNLSWEHERDFMRWEEAVTNLNHFGQLLDRLKTHV
jgi:hypothetical protein